MKKVAVYPLVSPSITLDHLERCLWSIECQGKVPFEFEVGIIVNSLNDPYTASVKEKFGSDYEVFTTESNGRAGKGHNGKLDTFRSLYKERGYTHLIPIDGDDYLYPTAFECIYRLHKKSGFDYLSGISPIGVDSLRPSPPPDKRPYVQVAEGLYIWTMERVRLGVSEYEYWNGDTCPGAEPILCLSAKALALENFRYTDEIGLAADYPFLCRGIASYLKEEMEFVTTDCNDIYVYDCTKDDSASRRKVSDLDPVKGWPFDKDGLLEKEIQKEEFHILKGITRLDLPYATLPQQMNNSEKIDWVIQGGMI